MATEQRLMEALANDLDDTASTGESGTLASAVYHRIRADIISGQLAPGTPLKLGDLRQRYDVGVSPIREALSRLGADTFVSSIENRGYRVAELSRTDLEDITETRVLIERRALEQAIRLGDVDWEAGIVAAHYRLTKLDGQLPNVSRDTLIAWERANHSFHDALVGACSSRWLQRFRELLQDQSKRYRYFSITDSMEYRDVRGEHDALMRAALARDSQLAADLVEQHIRATSEAVIDRIPV